MPEPTTYVLDTGPLSHFASGLQVISTWGQEGQGRGGAVVEEAPEGVGVQVVGDQVTQDVQLGGTDRGERHVGGSPEAGAAGELCCPGQQCPAGGVVFQQTVPVGRGDGAGQRALGCAVRQGDQAGEPLGAAADPAVVDLVAGDGRAERGADRPAQGLLGREGHIDVEQPEPGNLAIMRFNRINDRAGQHLEPAADTQQRPAGPDMRDDRVGQAGPAQPGQVGDGGLGAGQDHQVRVGEQVFIVEKLRQQVFEGRRDDTVLIGWNAADSILVTD